MGPTVVGTHTHGSNTVPYSTVHTRYTHARATPTAMKTQGSFTLQVLHAGALTPRLQRPRPRPRVVVVVAAAAAIQARWHEYSRRPPQGNAPSRQGHAGEERPDLLAAHGAQVRRNLARPNWRAPATVLNLLQIERNGGVRVVLYEALDDRILTPEAGRTTMTAPESLADAIKIKPP